MMTLEIRSCDRDTLNTIRQSAMVYGSLVVSPTYKSQGDDSHTVAVTGDMLGLVQIAYATGRWAHALGCNDITLRIY